MKDEELEYYLKKIDRFNEELNPRLGKLYHNNIWELSLQNEINEWTDKIKQKHPDLNDVENFPSCNIQNNSDSGRLPITEYMLKVLKDIKEHLELSKTLEKYQDSPTKNLKFSVNPKETDVFVVHGHDDALRNEVELFLKTGELNPIILKDKPNASRHILEKFIEESNHSKFAIILFTPDDIGYLESKPEEEHRPRQNVIFELGYFIHKLGKEKVCVLKKGDVKELSDFKGILYTPYDDNGSWKNKIANEMKTQGIPINKDKI